MKSVLQLHMKIEESREAIIRKSVNVIYEHIKYYLELSSLFFLGMLIPKHRWMFLRKEESGDPLKCLIRSILLFQIVTGIRERILYLASLIIRMVRRKLTSERRIA